VRLQPSRNYVSNDDIQTPPALARRLVKHFNPAGHILEPCAGDGHFLKALRRHVRQSRGAAYTRPKTESRRRLSEGGPTRYSLTSTSDATGVTEREARRWSARGLRQALARSAAKGGSRRAPLGDESHKSNVSARKCATHISWREIKKNRNFFAWTQRVVWIITNPPWSQVRRFSQHALSLADHVVFLITINHLWTRARLRDIKTAGFGLREIVMMDTPADFPPMGFQLGAVQLSRGWTGPVTLTDWNVYSAVKTRDSSVGATAEPSPLSASQFTSSSTSQHKRGKSAGCQHAPCLDQGLAELRAINRRLDALLATA